MGNTFYLRAPELRSCLRFPTFVQTPSASPPEMERRNPGSSTAVMEPIGLEPIHTRQENFSSTNKQAPSIDGRSLRSHFSTGPRRPGDDFSDGSDRNESLPSPTTAHEQLETWRNPR